LRSFSLRSVVDNETIALHWGFLGHPPNIAIYTYIRGR